MKNLLGEIEDIIALEKHNNSTLQYISIDGLEIDLDTLKAVANVEYDDYSGGNVVNRNLMLVYNKTIWLRTEMFGSETFVYSHLPYPFQKPAKKITVDNEEDLALSTFVCPGKYDYGVALRDCLTTIQKEG